MWLVNFDLKYHIKSIKLYYSVVYVFVRSNDSYHGVHNYCTPKFQAERGTSIYLCYDIIIRL